MDGLKPKAFGDLPDRESSEADPKGLLESTDGGTLPKKRKGRHRKFIDLQKQPPRPKPLIQE